jgi:hypothetical protein
MGMISSTFTSASGSCTTPAMTAGLWETTFNSNTETTLSDNNGRIEIDMKFRSDDGDLTDFQTIATDNGYTIPTSYAAVTATGSLAQVKRPNCECTTLHQFKMNKTACTGCMVTIVFEDGYTVTLGKKIQMLKISSSGLANTSLEDIYSGDMVVACGDEGAVNTTSTKCVKISTITKSVNATSVAFAYHPKSLWPLDSFSSTTCVFSLMLENGIYIFMTPDGGAY